MEKFDAHHSQSLKGKSSFPYNVPLADEGQGKGWLEHAPAVVHQSEGNLLINVSYLCCYLFFSVAVDSDDEQEEEKELRSDSNPLDQTMCVPPPPLVDLDNDPAVKKTPKVQQYCAR